MNNLQSFIFEYPLNDCIRACLKLEPILKRIDCHAKQQHASQHRAHIMLLIDLINILDRPDLKTKFMTLVTQQQTALLALEHNQNVDQSLLNYWLNKLQTLSQTLQQSPLFPEGFKQDHLLCSIRQSHSTPGGVADYNAPQLQCWLQQPTEYRLNQLAKWRQQLLIIEQLIATLLPLIRNTTPFNQAVTQHNFFQTPLNKNIEIHLVRIRLQTPHLFPEISVGKHRLSIHF